MSLIFWNKTTLKNNALIYLSVNQEGEVVTEKNDGYTIIKINNEISGINIHDADLILNVKEGAHSICDQTIKTLKEKLNLDLTKFDLNSKLIVGEVIEQKPHPKSDKLFLLKVNVGKELQIITNASNAIVGKKVVVAQVGAILPSGLLIKDSKVMGVRSEGMLCGSETLGLNKTDGVHIVENLEVGKEFTL